MTEVVLQHITHHFYKLYCVLNAPSCCCFLYASQHSTSVLEKQGAFGEICIVKFSSLFSLTYFKLRCSKTRDFLVHFVLIEGLQILLFLFCRNMEVQWKIGTESTVRGLLLLRSLENLSHISANFLIWCQRRLVTRNWM